VARSMIGPTYVGYSSAISRACTPISASSGSCETTSRSRRRAYVSTSSAYPSIAPSFPVQRTTLPS
jgi:hypothetical protein